VRGPAPLEAYAFRTTQWGEGEGGAGTREQGGAKATAKAGGQNERVPTRRLSMRAGEACMRTQSPSPRAHSIFVCIPIPGWAFLCLHPIVIRSPSARFAISIHLRRQACGMRECGEVVVVAASQM
jgi:hypothetical protein